jgi:hypothetical protein
LGKKGKWRAQVVAFIPGLVSQKPALCQLSARLLLAHFNPARPHTPPHDPPGPTRQRTPSRLVAQHRAQASVMLGGRTERKQNTQKVKLLAGAVSARAVLVQTPGVWPAAYQQLSELPTLQPIGQETSVAVVLVSVVPVAWCWWRGARDLRDPIHCSGMPATSGQRTVACLYCLPPLTNER